LYGLCVDRISTTRLYASSIAIVSGLYSTASSGVMAMAGPMMTLGGWIMLAIGIVVLVHGVMLLTPAAASLGRISGPLMIAWASIMLLNAWLLPAGGVMDASGGMVAIAVLMLVSGLIMTMRRSPTSEM
jgi:hypothetical protein